MGKKNETKKVKAGLDYESISVECKSSQATEIEVLESIYGKDFAFVQRNSQLSDQIAFRIRMEVVQAPIVHIDTFEGISDTLKDELVDALETLADENIGHVMIHDLVVLASDFMEANAKSQSSFFEQMVNRQSKALKEEMSEAMEEEEMENRKVMEEQHAIQNAIDSAYMEEKERIARKMSMVSVPSSSSLGEMDGDDSSYSDDSLNEMGGNEKSRYYHDFKQLRVLGKGGGGEVIQVKNRLDRQVYAVKRIKLDPRDAHMKRKILREVKTISRLQHRHIVRYFQAWLEGDTVQDDDSEEDWLENESEEEGDDWFEMNSASVQSRKKPAFLYMNSSYSSDDVEEDDDDDQVDMNGDHLAQEWASMAEAPQDFISAEPWEWTVDKMQQLDSPDKGTSPAKLLFERLYIQMEYCEGETLRQVIDAGQLHMETDSIWRLFIQILEALAYIHSKGLIHRDIKPPNIFLDSKGGVKVGDFGLATKKRFRTDDESDCVLHSAEILNTDITQENSYSLQYSEDFESDNITTGVGTALYRAPEQGAEGQQYNQSADMFSLGILFFEMWSPPFGTVMERAKAITLLREKNELLAEFMERTPEAVHSVINWLCESNPAQRPSASELLSSRLIPPRMEVEEEFLQQALPILVNPQGSCYEQLLDSLFQQQPEDHVDYTFDVRNTNNTLEVNMLELKLKSKLRVTMQNVFELHGAVSQSTPLLLPKNSRRLFEKAHSNLGEYSLLSPSGVVVKLPHSLTESFARFVARNNIHRLKRFNFAQVYRSNVAGSRSHPRQLNEADFDIIWNDPQCLRLVELETIHVVYEVMAALYQYVGPFYLKLSNSKLIKSIMEICCVPHGSRKAVGQLFSNNAVENVHSGVSSTAVPTLKGNHLKHIHKVFRDNGMHENVMGYAVEFLQLPEDPLAALEQVEKVFAKIDLSLTQETKKGRTDANEDRTMKHRHQILQKSLQEGKEGIIELRKLLTGMYHLQFDGPLCIRLDLGLRPREDHYSSGVVFQAALASSAQKKGRLMHDVVIAEGGRYDNLVCRYRLPAARIQTPVIAAIGVRFSMDKIAAFVFNQISSLQSSKLSSLDRAVLVCCVGKLVPDMTLQRMKISKLLWREGIAAEYLHPEAHRVDELEEYSSRCGIKYLVLVKKHLLLTKGAVKIRVLKNASIPVQHVALSSLCDKLKELESRSGAVSIPFDHGESEPLSSSSFTDQKYTLDIRILDGKHQQKDRQNRSKEIQLMEKRALKWIHSMLQPTADECITKLLCVDLPFLTLRTVGTLQMNYGHNTTLRNEQCSLLDDYTRYRKQFKYIFDIFDTIQSDKGQGSLEMTYIFLYSISDDRYDLLSLSNHFELQV